MFIYELLINNKKNEERKRDTVQGIEKQRGAVTKESLENVYDTDIRRPSIRKPQNCKCARCVYIYSYVS